jgi:hypothetical protein
MDLADFMQLNLSSLRESVADQILAVAWFSTSVDQKPLLNYTEIYMEFKELGFDRTHFNDAFSELITKEPKQLIQHALNDQEPHPCAGPRRPRARSLAASWSRSCSMSVRFAAT